MGVPTSEVGYNSVIPRREDHEIHKDIGGKKSVLGPVSNSHLHYTWFSLYGGA